MKGQEKKGEASSISMEEGEDNTTPGWDKVWSICLLCPHTLHIEQHMHS